MTPFSLKIFVADGDPDGLRLVERSNWIGKAVIFPRSLLPKIKHRSEFLQTGVYLLLGPKPEGEGDMLYIGEGDPVRPRLETHFSQKDFWTKAVFFVAGSGQLNKAHVQFLESNLVQLAKAAKRVPLDNRDIPSEPALSEADRADMQVFLDNMLGMLPVLGIHAFEQSIQTLPADVASLLTCRGKGLIALGYESTQGFLVKAGSQAALEATASLREKDLRQELILNGVLKKAVNNYEFAQDFSFSSPSLAAAVVLGRSANGRTEWKDTEGRTLKDIQTSQAESI